jgi:hypothetical protein
LLLLAALYPFFLRRRVLEWGATRAKKCPTPFRWRTRDQVTAALDANLSMVSVRQNEITAHQNAVVKQLTLVATVFLPLTFVTGFFGQNFGWMVRHINSDTAFFVLGIGGLIVSCAALCVVQTRRLYDRSPVARTVANAQVPAAVTPAGSRAPGRGTLAR